MTQLGIKPWREDEEIKPCADCGQLLVESQLDRGYCSDCIDSHIIICEDCGKTTVNPDNDDFTEHNHSWYCRDCFDQSLVARAYYCENCGYIKSQKQGVIRVGCNHCGNGSGDSWMGNNNR